MAINFLLSVALASGVLVAGLCPAGTAQGSTAHECLACRAGEYSSADATTCKSCPPGKWSGMPAKSTCEVCPSGRWSASVGMTSWNACTNCRPGKWSPEAGAASEEFCNPCMAGKYSADEGSADVGSCLACPAGKWSSLVGATGERSCISCAPGKFGNLSAMTDEAIACQDCPAGRWSAAGTHSCTGCPAGRYSTEEIATAGSTCLDCPLGTWSNNGRVCESNITASDGSESDGSIITPSSPAAGGEASLSPGTGNGSNVSLPHVSNNEVVWVSVLALVAVVLAGFGIVASRFWKTDRRKSFESLSALLEVNGDDGETSEIDADGADDDEHAENQPLLKGPLPPPTGLTFPSPLLVNPLPPAPKVAPLRSDKSNSETRHAGGSVQVPPPQASLKSSVAAGASLLLSPPSSPQQVQPLLSPPSPLVPVQGGSPAQLSRTPSDSYPMQFQ